MIRIEDREDRVDRVDREDGVERMLSYWMLRLSMSR